MRKHAIMRPISSTQDSAFEKHHEFEYDSKEKIDKRFEYLCKNYSHLWNNGDSMEEDFKSPRNVKMSKFENTPDVFRAVIRQKAIIPKPKGNLFASYIAEKPTTSPINQKFNSIIKKMASCKAVGSQKEEKIKEVKFGTYDTFDHIDMEFANNSNNSKLENTFKKVYEENYYKDEGHRQNLNEFFGNAVVAAFMESLIKLSLEEINKTKLNDKNNEINNNFYISPWIARSFGILTSVLLKLNSLEEKHKYILNCMQKTVDGLLDKYKTRHANREKLNLEETYKLENKKILHNIDRKDQFSWLNVKSRFEDLKKSLRGLIIEKLNHYENQEKIIHTLADKRNSMSYPQKNNIKHSLKSPDLTASSNVNVSQAFLEKIPNLTTSKILQNMTYDSKYMAKSFWNTASAYYNTDDLSQNYMKSTKSYMSKKSYLKQALNDGKEKTYKCPVTNEEKFTISKELRDIFNWTPDRETSFQETRANAKTKHVKAINVSNWYELAFLPMVQEININFKKFKQRDLKLQKFAEGEFLSADDLKFIVDTSDLLNSCVDKEFLQDAIDVIDEQVIRNLELYLAENILMNYEEIKSVIKESRLRYLENKNMNFILKDEKDEKDRKRQADILQKRKESQKTIKMYRRFCENIKSKEEIEAERKNIKFNQTQKILNDNSKEVQRRGLHPPSKIMSTSSYEKNDIFDEEKVQRISRENEKISHDYKLDLHSPPILKNSQKFIQFYSGGPILCPLPDKEIQDINFSQSDLMKITKLQSHFRRVLSTKRFNEMKNKRELAEKLRISAVNEKEPSSIARISIKPPSKVFKSGSTPHLKKKITINMETSGYLPLETPMKTNENLGSANLNLSTYQSSKSTFVMPTSERKKIDQFFTESSATLKRRKKNIVRVQKLFEAVKKNRYSSMIATATIYDKEDVNERDPQGNVALYYTCKLGNFDFCNFLISIGARVNEMCSNDNTPMHMACFSNNFDVIMLMISHKASMNAVNKDGLTPLAFLNESNLKRLNFVEGVVSVKKNENVKNFINNDSFLVQNKKRKELPNEHLIHSFEPSIHHLNDIEADRNGLQRVSSFKAVNHNQNGEYMEKSLEKENSFKNKLKKISFNEID